ncbi:WPP domain-interacting protein 2-like [Dorcoceras hygrometricum]|uniref:WPP domain-interacting protein 2-like n=1 Tax=Dorcoceras hygrometricum TaxID=472368 RepID=A0A2Z7BN46_9LAMI|nr:WPP domain-interacting protein 2-like [Dorcoceras hygrometricum]
MGTGIDHLNLHSVQLGYLKILQVRNIDPNNTKKENKYEVKPQYEELSKQLIMQHAIIDAMKCMRAIKDRIAKPVYKLAIISIEPLYHARCINRGNHRSVIIGARQPITARWSSDTTNQSVTTPMIALDFSGTTNQSASHNVALNQVIKSICQSGSRCMHKHISRFHNINRIHVHAQAAKSARFVPSTVEIYLNRFSQRHGTNNRSKSASSRYQIHGKDSLELKSKIAQHPKNALSDFSRNLRTPADSRSKSQVVLQPLMGNNRKSKSQGFQLHQNRSNHQRRTVTIGGN